MPPITEPKTARKKVPKLPQDQPIAATGCCGLCMYNIPQGTLMVLFPGLIILVVGMIMIIVQSFDLSWDTDISDTSIIFLIIGGCLTLGGLLFGIIMWCKYRPKRKQRRDRESCLADVELVGVYKISSEKMESEGRNGTAAATHETAGVTVVDGNNHYIKHGFTLKPASESRTT